MKWICGQSVSLLIFCECTFEGLPGCLGEQGNTVNFEEQGNTKYTETKDNSCKILIFDLKRNLPDMEFS